jgi:hypothetical protein
MRTVFKKILLTVGLILVAMPLIAYGGGGPWTTVGIGFLLVAAILTLLNVRDAICLGLRRFGLAGERNKVLVHLCAALMALFALTVAFGEVEARLHAIRWYLLLGLPMEVYLFSFLYDKLMSFNFGNPGRKASAHEQARRE